MLTPGGIRAKIGRHLSYPLKYTEISTLLAPACDPIALQVHFWSHAAPRPNETRATYQALEVAYRSCAGEFRYELTVRPVPRTLRALIHALLVSEGSGHVRTWLLAPRTPHWFSTYHALCIRFDALEQRLVRHEHNAA